MKIRVTGYVFFIALQCMMLLTFSQKKPLDHSVYDGWESLGEKKISGNGEWVSFTVEKQEGDGKLILKNPAKAIEFIIDRGYSASFSNNDQYLVYKIKHFTKRRVKQRSKRKSLKRCQRILLAF